MGEKVSEFVEVVVSVAVKLLQYLKEVKMNVSVLFLNVVSLMRIVDEELRPSKINFDESDLQDL